jgi:pimeloyl-ACP methyl ester carboxylesterase
MRRWKKWFLYILIAFLLLCLVGPLLLPVAGSTNATTEKQLADPDSKFVNVLGYDIHYKEMGEGERVLILMNGFGGNLYTWRKVMEPLSHHGRVIAFDRIGTGLSAHPIAGDWEGKSPYTPSMQPQFLIGLMDALGIEEAILVGNSQGGTVALSTALVYPERVTALVLADPAVYTNGGPPAQLAWIWRTPQMRRIGPWVANRFLGEANGEQLIALAWHDPSKFTQVEREEALKFFRVQNRDAALWEYTVANGPSDLADRVDEISLATLVIAGDDDRIVPTEQHVRLAQEIPNAQLVIIDDCGHIPQEEQPGEFMSAVAAFLGTLK